MRHFLLLIPFLLLNGYHALSQNDNVDLLVQSPDGKTVKLVWFIKNWDASVSGFDIKRKEGLEHWVKLNTDPILPGISAKKKLAIVESENTELVRIKDKLADMLKEGRLREIDNGAFLQKLESNDKEIHDINAMIALDYDIALICGFGLVDHTVVNKTNYEYGLFKHGTDFLLEKVSWNYGEIPDLNVVHEITSASLQGKNGIRIMWDADQAKMKAAYIVGFNLYRQGIRLNERPIVATGNKDTPEFEWYDRSANSGVANQYSISAESLFGIEGIIKPYTYNPQDHPAFYKKTDVHQINSLGYYFKEGMNIQWSFPKEYERFVKGFYVEKDNMPEGYMRVSKLLDPSDRLFIDKSSSQVSGYIRVRVTAVYNDKTVVPGNEKLYNYFPLRDPPRPLNTKIKSGVVDKKFVINITWDSRINGDSITDGYIAYIYDAANNKFNAVSEKIPVKTTSFTYTVQHGPSTNYRFYITAISRVRTESLPGDTVAVQTPSFDLPVPAISKANTDAGKGIVEWQYQDIQDLKGFRMYRNDTLVADEASLKKITRSFTSGELLQGVKYDFTIRAVAENGIVSEPSKSVQLMIPVEIKKPEQDYR